MSADLFEIAYAAGIFDGEGSITIARRYKDTSKHGGRGWVFRMVISNSDPRLLLWFRERWGGAIKFATHPRHPDWKPSGQWIASDLNGEAFLRQIRPFLLVKAERADIALAYRATFKRGKIASRDSIVQATRQELAEGMRILNLRGSGVKVG